MAPGLVTIDDGELCSGHEFSFGPEDWCGEPACGGYGNPMPGDGPYMDGCELDGDVIFDVYTNKKDIVISNVVATWNGALACSFTITWTTNVKSNSTVNYNASCAALNNVASDLTYTTSHSVVCDASVVSGGAFAYKVKSANSCDTEQSSCYTTRRPTCMGQ